MANECILIIDDDQDFHNTLTLYLEKEFFSVYSALNGFEALDKIDECKPDIIILDVVMPQLDGFELCQLIRKKTDVPILFFSTKFADIDQILGLTIGGDDYLDKSVHPAVLIAKIKAHLRRARSKTFSQLEKGSLESNSQNQADTNQITYPNLVINQQSATVYARNQKIQLTAKEFQLLCILANSPERVYSASQLFDMIWGEDSLGDNRTVMVHLSNIRKKIEENPQEPLYILTVRGIGYKFNSFH